jgi:hypothetical protein
MRREPFPAQLLATHGKGEVFAVNPMRALLWKRLDCGVRLKAHC